MQFKIKHKIVALSAVAAFVPVLIILIMIIFQKNNVDTQVTEEMDQLAHENVASISQDVYNLCETGNALIQQQVNYNLNVADEILAKYGGIRLAQSRVEWTAINQYSKAPVSVSLNKMYSGSRWLGQVRAIDENVPVVDEIKNLVGGTVTIFQRMNEAGDMLRVATNVEKLDGTRAIGTYIPATNPDGSANPVVKTVLSGETFRGRAFVVNAWYLTAYRPIKDVNGRVIGIIYVGIKQEAVESLRQAIMNTRVGKTGYVFVLGGSGTEKGQYIISKDGLRDGENILAAKDANGNEFIKSIVEKALSLKKGEVAFERYPWKNAGEDDARWKISAITYFEPWDWVIGAGTYEEDFLVARERVSDSLAGLLWWSVFGGLLFLGVGIFVAYYLGNRLSKPIEHMTEVADALAVGNLNLEIEHESGDETGHLADSFRTMLEMQKAKAEQARQIARGNLDVEINVASKVDVLGQAMVQMKDSLMSMKKEISVTIDAQRDGDTDKRCNSEGFEGEYANLLDGINKALDAVINPMIEGIEILRNYADGDLSRDMRVLPGKQIVFTDSLAGIKKNLQALIEEGTSLARAAENGELSKRGDSAKFKGGYREIIAGFNNTIDSLLRPVNEAVEALSQMADGDLTAYLKGEYRGDHARMKEAMNGTLDALNKLLGEVNETTEQVRSSSVHVSDASQNLSQGATEQASSLEEITASVNEFDNQSTQNADNAGQANKLSNEVKTKADDGNRRMKGMVAAMNEIKQSSDQINKIIKTIDEIAFQTNLLSLNAAVEAARAGVHGKGFAVVAEEVRTLAQKSAKAARETTELIEESFSKGGKRHKTGQQYGAGTG